MPYDGGDLYVKVELYINGSWIEVTSRARGGRAASGVEIEHGRGTGAIQAESSRCSLTLGNADGYVTEGNPESPWYPYIGRGTRLRVSVADVLVSDAVRFDGEIDSMTAVYPGGTDSSVRIAATGILGGQLGLGSDPLRCALERAISAAGPVAHWPLTDSAGSSMAGTAVSGGQLMQVAVGSPAFGETSGIPAGTGPTVVDLASATLSGQILGGAATAWTLEFAAYANESATGAIASLYLFGGTWSRVDLLPEVGGTNLLLYEVQRSGGVADNFTGDVANWAGAWHHYAIVLEQIGTTVDTTVYCDGVEVMGGVLGGRTLGAPARLELNSRQYFGPMAVMQATQAAVHNGVMSAGDVADRYQAMLGWVGEMAHERAERLGAEEGISVTVTGSTSAAMGAQSIDTLANLLIECETADQGLLSDGADGGGFHYRTLSSIYNQTAALAVTQGSLDTDVVPIWDNRNIRNDVTVSRPGGASSRQTDEDHVTRTRRRIKDDVPTNVETDDQLPHQAGWRLNIGTAPGPRYNAVGINMRNTSAALLADAVLALQVGDRFTVADAALPAQHPPGGIDALVIGWRELLDKDKWTFAPACVDYSPYQVGEWDDATLAKWDTAGSELHTAVDATATSFDVATTSGPLWTSDNAEDGFAWFIGGEKVTVTDIAASTITYGAVGTVSHGNNASVTPGLPASLAEGNLMVMVAAIRNSGTGVPNTPSGWTRWPAFFEADNVQVFAKIAGASESGPTVTFTGGVANADTTAQIIRLAGKWHDAEFALLSKASCLNSSAQDITYPGLPKPKADDCLILYVGWKQDDWTSVASPGTEIAEPDTTTGDDQGVVWAYQIQTTRTAVASGTFAVTGGAAAISRGAVMAIRCDYQTATVTRSVNGVSKSHAAGAEVRLWTPMRWAL